MREESPKSTAVKCDSTGWPRYWPRNLKAKPLEIKEPRAKPFFKIELKGLFNHFYWQFYDCLFFLLPYQELLLDVYKTLDLRPGMRVLDVGCGTGHLEQFVLAKSKDLRIEAIDFSPTRLKLARRKLHHFTSVNFKLADLNKRLDYPNNYFDRVVSINTLHLVNNPFITLRECLRVLKPHGRLVITDPRSDLKIFLIIKDHLRKAGLARGLFKYTGALGKIFAFFPLIKLNLGVGQSQLLKGAKHKPVYLSVEAASKLARKVSLQEVDVSSACASQNWLACLTKTFENGDSLKVEKERVVENEWEREILKEIYLKNFEETDKHCVCKQSYSAEELEKALKDPDILKVILYNSAGYIVGFGLITNNLEKVPWVSKAYFKNNFPDYFDKKIYYIKSFVIDQKFRGFQAAKKLLGEMISEVPKDGVGAFDFSEKLNGLIPNLARKSAPDPIEPIFEGPVDRQVYHVFKWSNF